jgi:hypothetical protein
VQGLWNPANRYASAREFTNDLSNPESVGVAERGELRDWKLRRSSQPRTILMYVMFAMIPMIIFVLLLVPGDHRLFTAHPVSMVVSMGQCNTNSNPTCIENKG